MKLEYEGPIAIPLVIIWMIVAVITLSFAGTARSDDVRPPLIIDENPCPPIEDIIIEQPE